MKTSFIACIATSVLSASIATAAPGGVEGGAAVDTRGAKVKFNQYPDWESCTKDKRILYHAAPVSGRCYDIDDKTGAFFYQPDPFNNVVVYGNKGCTGPTQRMDVTKGQCINRNKEMQNSIRYW